MWMTILRKTRMLSGYIKGGESMKRKLVPIILVLFLVACAGNFVSNGYKTLSVSKEAYDSSLSILGDLYKKGQVGEDVKAKAIELGTLYKAAHNEAAGALLAYQSSGSQKDRDRYALAIKDASERLSRLLEYIKPYIGGE